MGKSKTNLMSSFGFASQIARMTKKASTDYKCVLISLSLSFQQECPKILEYLTRYKCVLERCWISLMHMYSNCFYLEDMQKVFQKVDRNSDILIWTW
jgi:hypothetical protein